MVTTVPNSPLASSGLYLVSSKGTACGVHRRVTPTVEYQSPLVFQFESSVSDGRVWDNLLKREGVDAEPIDFRGSLMAI